MNHKLKFFFDLKEVLLNWGLSVQQSNILDIIAGIQEFDLKIFQRPTGDDFRK
jgi:hypothetical protein